VSFAAALLALAHATVPSQLEQTCLAITAYTEARGEGVAGMAGVMYVAIERAHDPRHRWPQSVCAVTTQPAQFSGVARWDPRHVDKTSWYSAYELAAVALNGAPLVPAQCRGAVFFDAHSKRNGALCSIGNHTFYGAK